MSNKKVLSVMVFIFVVAASGCEDSKKKDGINNANQWDNNESSWDNSTWD